MATPTVLVSTWADGVFALVGDARDHELPGQSVRALASDGRGGALAIVDGHALCRRAAGGSWSTLATAEADLACCVAVGEAIYVGTEDARVLRLVASGTLAPLAGFDAVSGRETWYAGQALVEGRLLGPPLGIRSITATADGATLLANVHVGGIPRSTDGGTTWQPTIDIDNDVHEVRAHPERPEIVVAAAAAGLCISRDGGATWVVQSEGLHADYCSAVAFAGEDVLVAASESHFATEGGIYRRPVDGRSPLVALGAGLPEWLEGIADTGCIATNGATIAIADRGSAYVSADTGHRWSRWARGLPGPSSVLVV
jgi:photosystem II stability/assembly factor-like uncharacterized protein